MTMNILNHIDATILRRSAVIALILGSILTLVNQSAAVYGGAALDYVPLALVFVLPFIVVTLSQALGVRRARHDVIQNGGRAGLDESILATGFSHGIPLRAFLVSIIAGSINASITISMALWNSVSLANLPAASLVQAYALPLLFGFLSQTISYRRAIQAR